MSRSTYLLFALTSILATGVLLVIAFNPSLVPSAMTRPSVQGAIPTATVVTQRQKPEGPLPIEPGCHDPVLIKEGPYYYVFYTGNYINSIRSRDLVRWEFLPVPTLAATSTSPATRAGRAGRGPRAGVTFPGMPNSITALGLNNRDLWAPDVVFHNGRFLLYYSASSFGSRNSAIGLATNITLDPASPNYQWRDEGVVIRSTNSDNFNAIDPNFVLDEKGQPWLSFGSFWSGIKLRKLAADGKPDPADPTLYAIAARTAPETAIEAPFIIREGRYFYLFVSWDKCCQGLNSTYRMMVGRSEKITGPYLDKEGKSMAQGGGTQLLAGDPKNLAIPTPRLIGPGHQGLFKDGNQWLMVHHFYDGNTNGTSRLQVRPVTFDIHLWPVLGKPINSPS